MSVTSSLRRSVYGVPPDNHQHTKQRWYAKQRAERGAVHRRAEAIFDREQEKKRQRTLEKQIS